MLLLTYYNSEIQGGISTMQILFILGTVFMGIILIVMFKLPVYSITVQNSNDKEKISDDKLFSCILPNNKGRSVDEVVSVLEENNIQPEFHMQKQETESETFF